MFYDFLANPLGNSDFFHAQRVGNHIGMVTNPIDNGFCAELLEFITGELFALIAALNIVANGAVQKSVVSTIFALITHKVRKAAMATIRKSRTCSAKQSADRRTLFVRDSFHKSSLQIFLRQKITVSPLLA